MNGLRIEELDSRDMLDVLHYFFEEDMYYSSAEQAEGRDRARQQIYSQFYGSEYPYAITANKSNAQGGMTTKNFDLDEEEGVVPFDPLEKSKPTKPFVPPTPVNAKSSQPFGSVLDGPLTN